MGALSVLTFQLNAAQVIVDDTGPDNVVVSAWLSATGATAHFGAGSQYASVDGGVDSFRFVPNLPFAGAWRVEAWNSCFSPRATNVPHVVSHTGGTTVVEVDQDPATGSCGDWALPGDFSFDSGTTGSVEINDQGLVAGSYIGADAVRFTSLDDVAINTVTIDQALGEITLSGTLLDAAGTPTVTVGGLPAGVIGASTSTVVTQVPAGLGQGTHTVRLDTGGESAEAGLTVRNSSSAFTEYTESAPLSFGFHGQTNWSYGLSGAPRMVQVYLMNVTPTGQYLPGDLVQVPTRAYDGNRNYQGVTVILDRNGSTIRVRTGNPIPLAGKNSGNHLVVPSRWRFVIRAWRSPAADDLSGPGCGG